MSDLPIPWTIGVVRHGPPPPKPSEHPLHWLTLTFTYEDPVWTDRRVVSDHYCTAAEAQADWMRRKREVGKEFRHGPGWAEYRDSPPIHAVAVTVRLEWSDSPSTDEVTHG